MEIGLVGVGRMGKVLANLLANHVPLCLFDRNGELMTEVATKLNVRMVTQLEDIMTTNTVILAVPDHEVVSCIKVFNQIKSPLRVINIATNVDQSMLEKIAAPHVQCICIKIIGHADEIGLGQRPVIVVNESPAGIVQEMVEIFQHVGQVLVGRADVVQFINSIAAEKALEAAVGIEETLKQHDITDPIIINSAIRQVASGIMKAYADGNMGPFAREIVQSVRKKVKLTSAQTKPFLSRPKPYSFL